MNRTDSRSTQANHNSHPIGRIAFVGNYLPSRCGIATFTTDLTEALGCYIADTAIAEIMSRDMAIVERKATVAEAAEMMSSRNISCILVAEGGKAKGGSVGTVMITATNSDHVSQSASTSVDVTNTQQSSGNVSLSVRDHPLRGDCQGRSGEMRRMPRMCPLLPL